ncbi:TIR domain-containing protein [Parasphingopyxis lamellibrachiae]|uniref:TonB-like protein n=1 Tax=Parasphingopyxis lamellibrachiae TaxID=680125 RepID=A0A3D9FF47_9SPHN|nr:TIR domain-containing protein [Parasphingopyxis lamellibrachiae]RED16278.1 TonB-like protein [Parasphingopyxis lamellibrachiae]
MGAEGADTSGQRRPVAFISHHSSQVETARQLKKVLGSNGVDGWMAPDDIDPGRPFDQAIIEQVRRSDLIILLFCSRSDQSRHVKRELMMAENGDKLIFPVRLENIDAEGLAYWLNDYQWIDWFDRRDDTIQRMIDTIKRIVAMSVAKEQAGEPVASAIVPPPEESAVASPPAVPPVPPEETESEKESETEPVAADIGVPSVVPPTPPAEQSPAQATAKLPEPPDTPDQPSPLKVAPVASGRAAPGDGEAGGNPPNRKTMMVIGAAVLAIVVILLLFFFLSGGESGEEAENSVLSPSVDCANTDLASHGIICASEALRSRESELSDLYEAVLTQADGQQRIALQQGYAAYQARRDECRTAACVATVYDAREGELGQYDLPVEADPDPAAEEDQSEEAAPEMQVPESPGETAPAERTPAAERPTTPVETRPAETRPAAQPDPPRTTRTTPPEPIGNPGNWVRASDYPANILRNGEEGTSRFQVRVGANGVPTACFTIGSSGHFQLDARACNMVMSRGRFRPGRDASGNPVAGLYSGSYRWRAPR